MNIPNSLSIFRIILSPVFLTLYFAGEGELKSWALAVYIFASATDFLDGYIARKYNMSTNLGKLLDPIGDKLLTFSAVLALSIDGRVPVWCVVALFIKELLMGIGGIWVYRELGSVVGSNIFGKAATCAFIVACAALMWYNEKIPANIATLMISAALCLTFIAFFSYVVQVIKILKPRDKWDRA